MIFLVQYDRRAGKLLRFDRYADHDRKAAEQARWVLELSQLGVDAQQEIVLFEAEDEQALRRTHGRYFESIAGLIAASDLAAH